MRLTLASAFCALLSMPAGAASLHEYGGLVMSPAGDRVASLESNAVADSTTRAHSKIIIRSVADGHVLATIDPCADCGYSDLSFSPDGRLAFIERAKGSTQLMIAGAGAPAKVATIDGIAQDPRFSPAAPAPRALPPPSAPPPPSPRSPPPARLSALPFPSGAPMYGGPFRPE